MRKAKGPDKSGRIRMTVDFGGLSADRLVKIKAMTEAPSYVEVIRQALRAYERELEGADAAADGITGRPIERRHTRRNEPSP